MNIRDLEYAAGWRADMRMVVGHRRREILVGAVPRHARHVRIWVQEARRTVRPESHPPAACGWRDRKGKAAR